MTIGIDIGVPEDQVEEKTTDTVEEDTSTIEDTSTKEVEDTSEQETETTDDSDVSGDDSVEDNTTENTTDTDTTEQEDTTDDTSDNTSDKETEDKVDADKDESETSSESIIETYKEHGEDLFPGMTFETPEEIQTAIIEEINDLREYRKKNRVVNKAITDLMEINPAVTGFLKDLNSGATDAEAIARNFDTVNLQPQEGDPDFDAWEKGKKAREKDLKQRNDYEKMLKSNHKKSLLAMDAYAEKKGITKTEAQKTFKVMFDLINKANNLEVDESFLDIMDKAIHFKDEIAKAESRAELKAKNEKIAAEIQKDDPKGDGLPNLSGKGDDTEDTKKPSLKNIPFAGAVERWESSQIL